MHTIGFIGHESGTKITGLRKKWTQFWCAFSGYWVLFGSTGAPWVSVSRPEICFKEYCGPDWKADYDISNVGTIICNHTSFLDMLVYCCFQLPHFCAKIESLNTFGIGMIISECGSLFIDRNSKDSRV